MSSALDSFQAGVKQLESALDDPNIPWKQLVIYLLWATYAWETYVSLRQYRLYSRPAPPATLAAHVDLETYNKSQAYGRDKMRFGFVSGLFSQIMTYAIVKYDLYAVVWAKAGEVLQPWGYAGREIPHSILWMVGMFVIREIPMIPFSLFRNFVVEEKHGFNKMTIGTFVLDTLKEWAVGFAIGAPLMAGLLSVIRWAGDSFVAYVVGFLLAFQIIAMVLYPTVIQPLFNKLTPLPEGALRDRVVALASSLKFPLKHLYVIDGSKRSAHSNAYFFGVVPGGNKHIVIFDTLIEKSTPDEIEAVLAHELGHWAHSDPLKLLVLSQAQILFTMSVFTFFIHNVSMFRSFGFQVGPSLRKKIASHLGGSGEVANYLPVVVGLELFQLVLNPTDAILKFGLNSAIRSMEYAADRFAANLSRPPPTDAELQAAELFNSAPAIAERRQEDGSATASATDETATITANPFEKEDYATLLGRALVKLHVQNLSTMHHDPLYSAYHYSHPTLAERLQALRPFELANQEKKEQ